MAGRQHISNQYEYVGSSWGRRDVRPREQGFDALNTLPNVSSLPRSAPRTGSV
jgi:hypothetical protein